MTMPLLVKRLTRTAQLPQRGSELAAGYDLYADESFTVPARGHASVPTGIAVTIPAGCYGRVAPRSGLALLGIGVNAGVIDADFTSCIQVILVNHSERTYAGKQGHRIAQLIIERILTPEVLEVESLKNTTRGCHGLGSTGL